MKNQIKQFSVQSVKASELRQRKYALVRQYGIPENLLGGSLSRTYRRCGKLNCHCYKGKGHLQWSVTFCRHGKKRVERVPQAWVQELAKVVSETKDYLDAIGEVMAVNIELLAQTRGQHRETEVRRRKKKRTVKNKK